MTTNSNYSSHTGVLLFVSDNEIYAPLPFAPSHIPLPPTTPILELLLRVPETVPTTNI
jgi:hypothetical protein